MIVAFFSDGPHAAMAALLARTGLSVIGADSVAFPTPMPPLAGSPANVSADAIVTALAQNSRPDVVMALPSSLLTDRRLTECLDLIVEVVGEEASGSGISHACTLARLAARAPGRVWRMHSAASTPGSLRTFTASRQPTGRGPTGTLPIPLPEIHGSGTAFARDGVQCATPVREALLLVAVLQALAVNEAAADPKSALLEILSSDLPDGADPAVDRLRAIADRLEATSHPRSDQRSRTRIRPERPPFSHLAPSVPPAHGTRFPIAAPLQAVGRRR